MSGRTLWLSSALIVAAAGCEALIGLKDRVPAGGDSGIDGPLTSEAACEQYCEEVQQTCDGKYTMYPPKDAGNLACKKFCALLTADELECRQGERQNAASSQELYTYCQGAGPGGSEACGPSNCKTYCKVMNLACSEQEGTTEQKDTPEESIESCERKCAVLHDREDTAQGRDSRFDVVLDHEGDTLQCRLVHLVNSALTPKDHCWHAALAPHKLGDQLNPCATDVEMKAPSCQDYCRIVTGACTEADQVYESEEQCLATCDKLDLGLAADDGGQNTIGCRKAHAYNALVTEMYGTHCPHAGPGGQGVCGDDCTPYCSLLQQGCSAGFAAEFGTGAAAAMSCKMDCEELRDEQGLKYSVAVATAGDDALACRLLNVTRALERPEMADMFCPSALGRGDCK